MAERNLAADHVTIWRWVQRYAPILNQRLRRELRCPNGSWRVDETYVKVAGRRAFLYRAVDSAGEAIEFMLSPEAGSDRGEALPAARVIPRWTAGPRYQRGQPFPPHATPIAELKQTGELGRRCCF
jgi:transposase, IS6 family